MKKKVLFILTSLLLSSGVFSQTGTIIGNVKDKNTQEFIKSAFKDSD